MSSVTRTTRRALQTRPLTPLPYRYASRRLLSQDPTTHLSESEPPYTVSNARNRNHLLFVKKDDLARWTLSRLWLRENCRCSKCVNPQTMQRNFNVLENMHVQTVRFSSSPSGLEVIWDEGRGKEHASFYDWDFLERYISPDGRRKRAPANYRWQFWGSEIADKPPTVNYGEVMESHSNQGLAKLLEAIARYGLVFVDNTPYGDAIHTKTLLERIGPIRETHYGGFYDFVPDMAKADTAYTNIALPAHTDTTYFTDPAGLQAFHLLSHTASPNAPEGEQASGGQSLLVDGYRAAAILKAQHPWSFNTLKWFGVPWHASGNEGITITPGRLYPVFDVSKDPYEHMVIRWNNDDRGVLPINTAFDWIKAATRWNEILKSRDSEYWFQLKPGRTLIFDNHRVLHGRSAFVGMRRICGGYINRDDWVSRWRNTTLSKKEVRDQVIG